MHENSPFGDFYWQNFWGGAGPPTAPSPDPSPMGKGTPSPHTLPPRCLRHLIHRAYGTPAYSLPLGGIQCPPLSPSSLVQEPPLHLFILHMSTAPRKLHSSQSIYIFRKDVCYISLVHKIYAAWDNFILIYNKKVSI